MNTLSKLLLNKAVVKIILALLNLAAKQTDNTIDDEIVEAVKKGFEN